MIFTIKGENAGLTLMLVSIFMISLVALCVKMIPTFNAAETIYIRALVGFAFSYIVSKKSNTNLYINNTKELLLVYLNSIVIFVG